MKSSEQIAHLIERMGRLVVNGYHADGFKPVQWEVLHYLDQANVYSRNPAAVGEYLGITKGTVSQTLSTLEARGLLRKKANKQDKRAVVLELTAAGRKLVSQSPLETLVQTIDVLEEDSKQVIRQNLSAVLLENLDQRGRRPFGICKDCTHLDQSESETRCSLLDVPLSKQDTECMCAEQLPKGSE